MYKILILPSEIRIFSWCTINLARRKGGDMGNLFFKYLDNRIYSKSELATTKKRTETFGPLITVSRQAGCSAKEIASHFYKTINRNIKDPKNRWKCVDKDIILNAANKLDLDPKKIKHVFNSPKKSTMDEIIESLAHRYYKSDKIIRNTIVNVMKEYAERGKTIIVGRAGVALSQHVKQSFNIRLMAPLDWRIEQISKKHGISEEDAKKYILEMDYQRRALIEGFYGKKLEDSMFDIIFNCKSISKKDIVHCSLGLMKKKGIIKFN
jgi:cytidylate kinase